MTEKEDSMNSMEETGRIILDALETRLEEHDDNRRDVQGKLHDIFNIIRKQVDDLENELNGEIEEKFFSEDDRYQTALNTLRTALDSRNEEEEEEGSKDYEELSNLIQKAKAELLVKQIYEFQGEIDANSSQDVVGVIQKMRLARISKEDNMYKLNTNRVIVDKWFDLSKPRDLKIASVKAGRVFFSIGETDEEKTLEEMGFDSPFSFKVQVTHRGLSNEYEARRENKRLFSFLPGVIESESRYVVRVKSVYMTKESEWSDEAEFVTEFQSEANGWKEYSIMEQKKWKDYAYDDNNKNVVIKIGYRGTCTVVGSTAIPRNKVTSWNIKIRKSYDNNGYGIYVGVAPFDIDTDDYNIYQKCGWYFDCWNSSLYSGPPHNYRKKEYGLRIPDGWGKYVRTGDTIGVVADMVKGSVSFVVNGVNYDLAYKKIPLDKPLVPCVVLEKVGDSVEFIASEAKENVADAATIPRGITRKSVTCDSLTLSWDPVEGAAFYQVEVDGGESYWVPSTLNTLMKRGFSPETEHSLRIRTIFPKGVSGWSDSVGVRTQKESFEASWWRECPDWIDDARKYSGVKDNQRVAINTGGGSCTVVGTSSVPQNKVTSWNIKVQRSRDNDGRYIFIGVAPSNIDLDCDENFMKCGWYLNCYDSTLWSGPPHNNKNDKYGPKKGGVSGGGGKYVHTGDSVGVTMDMTRGELSFMLGGVNLGVAYEGIPLDKPLVPCVVFENKNDSIELDMSDVKEVVDNSIPVPPNITTKSITWDSIVLTWDAVEGASFYQVEVDGSKFWDAPTTNTFTKGGLLPDTEYTFRVRTVRGALVGEWGSVVGRTSKKTFDFSGWKACPAHVDKTRKYSVNEKDPRIATNAVEGWCTIVRDTTIPLNTVTSWKVTVLKTGLSGAYIYIGVAPADINQDEDRNFENSGWYFCCYSSTLWSGPPHNRKNVRYGPKKWDGSYVLSGDTVGVVMDTEKGELSFELKGRILCVAFEGIPLDKPLAPCVILRKGGDSVQLK